MKLRIAMLREQVRSSLWFLPTVCVALAFVIAEIALRIDDTMDQDGSNWFLFGGGTDSARAVVSTIATSMLTFTGLVFSVTMLVLQLAGSQLSPRVMRTFLRDRANQLVLGIFVATFVYALLVLRRITSLANGDPFVPALSVWLALMLVLVCIALFIFYIHHMAQAIRPVAVMGRVASETRDAIARLYPAGIGEPVDEPIAEVQWPVVAVVLAPGSGILTGIDEDGLLDVARQSNCVLHLRACIGDFVREGAPLITVRGEWDGSAEERLQHSVSLGIERTMHQDAAFGLRQLVDIADRALSPGLNDPSTAVQAIDFLHDLLGRLATRSIPSPVRRIDDRVAVILPRPGWPDFVALACDEIRRAGRGQVQVQRRMRDMLEDLLEIVPAARRPPLHEQLALLDAHLADEFLEAERRRASVPSAQGHGPAAS